ncbi:MAG: hypothetical protein H6972_12495 [Gammaproteobacteria bacterium]|nr:hypothetical protein [Gammaproteobacteria bacterium]
MAKPALRAIDPALTATARDLQRDHRRLGQRLAAAGRKPDVLGVACFVLAGVAWAFPAVVDLAALGGVVLAGVAWRLRPVLPLKLPDRHVGADPHERTPGSDRPRPACGLLYLGNDRFTGEELYLSDEDARTHFLVLGGTGAGKTVAMVSLALGNALLWGSGCTYVDGKGDASLWTTCFAMARACGREDDLYILNYLTGSTDVDLEAPGAERLSNTFNPFLFGSADALTQMLVAQMAEAGGDSATWKDKAIALLTAYIRALVAMRDRGVDEHGQPFTLDVGALRVYLTLDRLIDLYLRARDQVDGFTLPGPALEALHAYLESVPGFQDPAQLLEAQGAPWTVEVIRQRAYPPQADPQTYLQHGYLQNQFNRMFGQLADVYGHIFRVRYGEIDLSDVVLQRRILVAMLPALEKSPDELASLGKLLIASLKTMLAVGLGARLEGTHRAVIERRPTTAPSPYFGAFDEYGYYAVEGFAVVPAQARSLGFSVLFGGQDLPSFGKKSKEEADAIIGNTLTKLGMKIEDPKDTMELFEKVAGRAVASQANHLTRDHPLLTAHFSETPTVQMEAQARIDPLDIREQGPGEAHVLRGSTLVRANLFFAGQFRAKEYRINRFVPLGPPEADELAAAHAAQTPEALRAAVAAVTGATLEPLHRCLPETRPLPDSPRIDAEPDDPQRFADRLIGEYLSQYARLDAALAARFRAAASGLPVDQDAAHVEAERQNPPPFSAMPDDRRPGGEPHSAPFRVTAETDDGGGGVEGRFEDAGDLDAEEDACEAPITGAPIIPPERLAAAIVATETDPMRREEWAREQRDGEAGDGDFSGWVAGWVQAEDGRSLDPRGVKAAGDGETGFDQAARALDPDFVGKAPKAG